MRGKRPRPPIKRTASMKEFVLDLSGDHGNAVTARPHRRVPAGSPPASPHFLSVCSLCHRGLIPGHDIYMYRGDTAFCSLECRQLQMNQDERKAKCLLLSNPADGSSTGENISSAGETVRAV